MDNNILISVNEFNTLVARYLNETLDDKISMINHVIINNKIAFSYWTDDFKQGEITISNEK